MSGPRTVAPPRPQRGTAADDSSAGNPLRHTTSTDNDRPKHGELAYREYGLLTPTGTAVDQAEAGYPGSEAGNGAAGEQTGRKLEEGGKTQQHALPPRIMRGSEDKGGGPPKRLRTLNTCNR